MSNYRLSPEQQAFYKENGYLTGLPPVYSPEEIKRLREELPQLTQLLEEGESTKDIREWHEASRYLYDICMNPKILDLVEGVLGPNFYMWASNFFIKEPRSKATVGWHQDSYYWPMEPQHSVTVWLAFNEVSEENAAMQVVPGTHKAGLIKHMKTDPNKTDSVLTLELDGGSFDESSAVSLNLAPGQCSLHDDAIVHGSPSNRSDRPRIGLTIRYSSTECRNDYSVNPNFKIYMCRGEDTYQHNQYGPVPESRFGRPNFKAVSKEEAGKA
jgi:chlorinating enzyme